MRALLRVAGAVVLVTGGLLALAGGVAAWSIGAHRHAGAFVTTLAPVRTDGYAVVVPDVAGVLSRHGVARLLGDGRLTIDVRSSTPVDTDLVVVALVPAGDAQRYLAGLARTEVSAVGYSTGLQPVQAVEVPGVAPSRPAPWEATEPVPGTVVRGGRVVTIALDLPTDDPMALVVRRADGAPGFSATITAGFAPASWSTATVVTLLAGGLGTVTGLALILLRRPWIDELHPWAAQPELEVQRPVPPRTRARAGAARAPAWLRIVPHWVVPRRRVAELASPESPYVHTAT